MPVTPNLPLKLYQKLGEEAMAELASWFGDWKNEMEALRADIETLKEADARLEAKMVAGFADLKAQIAGVQAELIKWTFVFWLGTAGIVVLLIRFLNNNPT